VGHLVGISVESDMLHLELYGKQAHGPLSVPRSESAVAPSGRPFMRRRDLTNPEPFLDRWRQSLPTTLNGSTAVAVADARPEGIPATGFCVYIRRVRQEQRAGIGYPRTIGDYRCYWNGEPIHDLEGQMVERGGPGDNTDNGVERHRRIAAGRYPLAVHAGTNYKTKGYAPGGMPLPGLAVDETGERTAILIHPAHHPNGYVSSIGCLNPGVGLRDADSRIALADSRSRVVAMIEGMKAKLGSAFPRGGPIPDAVVVIDGEPS
jgi:hypothetical protein